MAEPFVRGNVSDVHRPRLVSCRGLKLACQAVGRDGQPVRLIVLLASPPDRTSDHIQALAQVSRLMIMESFRERIYSATSAAEIYELLRSQEKPA